MSLAAALMLSAALAVTAQSAAAPPENLGKVDFPVSCAKTVRAPFSRGVALVHDFWYDEAKRQFQRIAKADPHCAMAHWGIAISTYHQIWDRPDEDTLAKGWEELRKAAAPAANTARERAYVEALGRFFNPDRKDYQARVDAYSAAMAELYRRYPGDVDAGAFYALSLLAAEKPDDTSLTQEHRALTVLNPLFARNPDHPGLVHYIIHACDTPSLAAQGLAAARHYGDIASSGAHAVHMPGHIFARLGMWREDIRDNLASVEASTAAEARHESDGMDQFHSDDFLVYAYLQSGDEARAKKIVDETPGVMSRYEAMPEMTSPFMRGIFPYYRNKFPAFYDLEMRDWTAAAALEPATGGRPDNSLVTYWARIVADGHLRRREQAHADFEQHEALVEQMKHGKYAYAAESTGAEISHQELLAWVAFADADQAEALRHMRQASDLQDKVGQGEVDIPAREMLADMLLDLHYAQAALTEYGRALELSPNRFNGLFNAGRAAEQAGDRDKARAYYSALLESTDNGAHSARPEFEHAKAFVSSAEVASK
jgi:tetratricopeptide (TPR) repeat protein